MNRCGNTTAPLNHILITQERLGRQILSLVQELATIL